MRQSKFQATPRHVGRGVVAWFQYKIEMVTIQQVDCFIEKFKTLSRDGGDADLNISSRDGGLHVSLSLHLPNILVRDQPTVKPRRRNEEIPCKARRKAKRAAARAEAAATASAVMVEPVTAAYLPLPATVTEARPSPAAAMAASVPSSSAAMVETNHAPLLPSTATEDNIPTFAEMVETNPPSSLAEMVETTPPLPSPMSVNKVDTETQTEREDRESPERKRKKTAAAVTEAEILRDSSGDFKDASFEITDDEEEPDIRGREVTKSYNTKSLEAVWELLHAEFRGGSREDAQKEFRATVLNAEESLRLRQQAQH